MFQSQLGSDYSYYDITYKIKLNFTSETEGTYDAIEKAIISGNRTSLNGTEEWSHSGFFDLE